MPACVAEARRCNRAEPQGSTRYAARSSRSSAPGGSGAAIAAWPASGSRCLRSRRSPSTRTIPPPCASTPTSRSRRRPRRPPGSCASTRRQRRSGRREPDAGLWLLREHDLKLETGCAPRGPRRRARASTRRAPVDRVVVEVLEPNHDPGERRARHRRLAQHELDPLERLLDAAAGRIETGMMIMASRPWPGLGGVHGTPGPGLISSTVDAAPRWAMIPRGSYSDGALRESIPRS